MVMAVRKSQTTNLKSQTDELLGGKLDPKEEKVLDWILNGIVVFVLGWLALGIGMAVLGLFGVWK